MPSGSAVHLVRAKRRLAAKVGDMVSTYLECFDGVWDSASPLE